MPGIPDRDTPGSRLRTIRLALGYESQAAFAADVGVAKQATISDYETGRGKMSATLMAAVAGLCRDRAAVLQWLAIGGPQPPILPLPRTEPATIRDYIKEVQRALDAVETLATSAAPDAPEDVAARARRAVERLDDDPPRPAEGDDPPQRAIR